MKPAELLTLIGIIIAILAFIAERYREFIFLKFTRINYIVIFGIFFSIHYAISFDWLLENWFYNLSYFTCTKGIPANTWAYILTLILLTYIIYLVFIKFFPKEKLSSVLKYYYNLLISGKFTFIISLYEKFHYNDLIEFYEKRKKIKVKKHKIPQLEQQEARRKILEVLRDNRLNYAVSVYNEIINNEIFLDNVVNENPYFFTRIIEQMNFKNYQNEFLIQKYIYILLTEKNYHFKREIIEIINRSGYKDRYYIGENNKIIYCLLNDIKVAEKNEVQLPVGKPAIIDLEENKDLLKLLNRNYDDHVQKELWNYTFFLSLQFFDIMIREAIIQGTDWVLWLHIYSRFFKITLKRIPDNYQYDFNSEIPDLFHYVLKIIIEKQLEWLFVAYKYKTKHLVIDISKNITACLYELSQNVELKSESIIYLFKKLLDEYFQFSKKSKSNFYRTTIEKYMTKPVDEYLLTKQEFHNYSVYMKQAWNKFDKIPYSNFEENGSIKRFEENVLNKFDN